MDIEASVLFIKIVESRFHSRENVIRIKRDHIVKETSKFVHFTPYLDIRSSIFIEERQVLVDFRFEVIKLGRILVDQSSLFKHIKGRFGLFEFLDLSLEVFLEFFQLLDSLNGKVLRRWLVVLHTLQVFNDIFSIIFLFINY